MLSQSNGRRFAARARGYDRGHERPSYLEVTPSLRIPVAELEVPASRSGDPAVSIEHLVHACRGVVGHRRCAVAIGGAAGVAARAGSPAGSILRGGCDWCRGSRSQLRNREDVTARLGNVVAEALKVRKKRKATRPSKAAKAARLEAKRRRCSIKRERRRPPGHDE